MYKIAASIRTLANLMMDDLIDAEKAHQSVRAYADSVEEKYGEIEEAIRQEWWGPMDREEFIAYLKGEELCHVLKRRSGS